MKLLSNYMTDFEKEFEKLDKEYNQLVKALDENIIARRDLCKKMNELKKKAPKNNAF